MWARVVEVMIAIWLSLSPFIFRHPPEDRFLWTNDFVCACLIVLFALLSFWRPLQKIHLATLGISFWLWALGYTNFPERACVGTQNSVVIGLLLLMLAIIPSHSEQPSPSWKRFIRDKAGKDPSL